MEYAHLVAPHVNECLERVVGRPRQLLDLACGTGTHALIQSARGVDVIGLDLSKAMLAVAQAKAESTGQVITWIHGDMRSFDVVKPVDAVTCLYASLNHLAHLSELKATFAHVAAHLRPGGVFIFDLNTRVGFEVLWREPGTDTGPGLRIDRRYEWDGQGPCVAMYLQIERRQGDVLELGHEILRARWFEEEHVRTALLQAGLKVRDVTPFNPFPDVDHPGIKQLWTVSRPADA